MKQRRWTLAACSLGALASVACSRRGETRATDESSERPTRAEDDAADAGAPDADAGPTLGWAQVLEVPGTGATGPSRVAIGTTAALVSTPTASGYQVQLFSLAGRKWSLASTLEAPLNSTDFGASVALSDAVAAVGAVGAVYLFTPSGPTWAEAETLGPGDGGTYTFGASLAVDGATIVVGSSVQTGAYVFVPSGGFWVLQQRLVPGADASAGSVGSVAVSGDNVLVGVGGPILQLGNPTGGLVYAFARDGGAWSEMPVSPGSDDNIGVGLGYSVAVHGPVGVAGAPGGAGVQTYAQSGGVWAYGQLIAENSDSELTTAVALDFGTSVALGSGLLVVGDANYALGGSAEQGAAYAFAAGGAWPQTQLITASDGVSGSQLGWQVATSGTTILVGANAAVGGGAAYFEAFGPVNGSTCTDDSSCASGFCSHGVCCDTACDGGCEACSLRGVCTLTPSGETGSCGAYLCAGGTSCPSGCTDDSICASGFYCAAGSCAQTKGGGATCTASNECASGGCVGGLCQGISARGASCASASDCASSWCVDGVCCDESCSGQCEACDVSGSKGTCSPVSSGEPHGSRPGCGFAGSLCAGTCDGESNSSVCAYPTTCGTTCTDSVETDSVCTEQGECVRQPSFDCNGLLCDGTTRCKSVCTQDDDCVTGYACQNGVCEPENPTCSDPHTSSRPGGSVDCSPFLCDFAAGTCITSCKTAADCVAPSVCFPGDGRCAAPPSTGALVGCSLGPIGRDGRCQNALEWWALLALAVKARRRVVS